jgi:hypothetical protein
MKKRKKILAVFILLGFSLSILLSFTALAAGYENQQKIPGSQPTDCFSTYLKQIINFGFAVIGILAMFMLAIGAYQYLMSAGNIGSAESAKATIGSALGGLILGLCAWIILNTVNPDFVGMKGPKDLQCGGGGGNPGTPPPPNPPPDPPNYYQ